MISYNTKDFNIEKIQKKLNILEKFNLKNRYRIYGINNNDHPDYAILLRGKMDIKLTNFLNQNKIPFHSENIDSEKYTHSIGIRRDLRSNIKISSLILFTIVGLLDNFIKTKKSLKIRNLDKKIGKLIN